MSNAPSPSQTDLIDENVVYATGNDVFTHIRNKRYPDLDTTVDETDDLATATSLTQKQVADLIARFTERADKTTRRAWRRRKVEDWEVRVKLSHTQKRARHRRRRRTGGGQGRVITNAGYRGMANLPHNWVTEVESVEVLNPRDVQDITDDRGREDGSYIVDERKGVIRPNVNLFVPTGRGTAGGRDIDDARLRVTYTYGSQGDEDAPDLPEPYTLSTTVPGDIRDAVALLTAARLVGSDQYGELTPNQSGDEPSLAEAVSSWRAEAKEVLREYGRP